MLLLVPLNRRNWFSPRVVVGLKWGWHTPGGISDLIGERGFIEKRREEQTHTARGESNIIEGKNRSIPLSRDPCPETKQTHTDTPCVYRQKPGAVYFDVR
jgi:hypothetical protein